MILTKFSMFRKDILAIVFAIGELCSTRFPGCNLTSSCVKLIKPVNLIGMKYVDSNDVLSLLFYIFFVVCFFVLIFFIHERFCEATREAAKNVLYFLLRWFGSSIRSCSIMYYVCFSLHKLNKLSNNLYFFADRLEPIK